MEQEFRISNQEQQALLSPAVFERTQCCAFTHESWHMAIGSQGIAKCKDRGIGLEE